MRPKFDSPSAAWMAFYCSTSYRRRERLHAEPRHRRLDRKWLRR
jgi:hypothetical protein